MAPIRGVAHVAYLPGERVVGISKLARLVDAYARRLQIQERMTNEIADTLDGVLHPRGVAVVIQASHECISSRGIGMHGEIGRANVRTQVTHAQVVGRSMLEKK